MMTAFASIETAVKAMRAGAYDYLIKPLRKENILHRLAQIGDMIALRNQNHALRNLIKVEEQRRCCFSSASMLEIDRLIRKYGYRTSPEHVAEIAHVVDFARRAFGQPVWLVGTSRGSVSATAAAIALGPQQVQGLVLTASVTSKKPGAVPTQDLARIQVPTLVLHHRLDACHVCRPQEAARIPEALTAAPRKQFILVDGGSDPSGEPCEALHWHGFIHFEKETVGVIGGWVRESLALPVKAH
jgi:pimeloyl-ACP methyl ester carboxylesterase